MARDPGRRVPGLDQITIRHGSIVMCGIAGLIVTSRPADGSEIERRARAMSDAIAYRGPDGSGVWSDAEAGVALAHRRLAIVDLTPTGAQPMVSADGRWVISYNGEVYNAENIAAGLRSAGFVPAARPIPRSSLKSVARRGIERTLADLNGMFAIALWDRADTHATSRSRSPRHQAAVLCKDASRFLLCL